MKKVSPVLKERFSRLSDLPWIPQALKGIQVYQIKEACMNKMRICRTPILGRMRRNRQYNLRSLRLLQGLRERKRKLKSNTNSLCPHCVYLRQPLCFNSTPWKISCVCWAGWTNLGRTWFSQTMPGNLSTFSNNILIALSRPNKPRNVRNSFSLLILSLVSKLNSWLTFGCSLSQCLTSSLRLKG